VPLCGDSFAAPLRIVRATRTGKGVFSPYTPLKKHYSNLPLRGLCVFIVSKLIKYAKNEGSPWAGLHFYCYLY
jgi:hypothetical protein